MNQIDRGEKGNNVTRRGFITALATVPSISMSTDMVGKPPEQPQFRTAGQSGRTTELSEAVVQSVTAEFASIYQKQLHSPRSVGPEDIRRMHKSMKLFFDHLDEIGALPSQQTMAAEATQILDFVPTDGMLRSVQELLGRHKVDVPLQSLRETIGTAPRAKKAEQLEKMIAVGVKRVVDDGLAAISELAIDLEERQRQPDESTSSIHGPNAGESTLEAPEDGGCDLFGAVIAALGMIDGLYWLCCVFTIPLTVCCAAAAVIGVFEGAMALIYWAACYD